MTRGVAKKPSKVIDGFSNELIFWCYDVFDVCNAASCTLMVVWTTCLPLISNLYSQSYISKSCFQFFGGYQLSNMASEFSWAGKKDWETMDVFILGMLVTPSFGILCNGSSSSRVFSLKSDRYVQLSCWLYCIIPFRVPGCSTLRAACERLTTYSPEAPAALCWTCQLEAPSWKLWLAPPPLFLRHFHKHHCSIPLVADRECHWWGLYLGSVL